MNKETNKNPGLQTERTKWLLLGGDEQRDGKIGKEDDEVWGTNIQF